MSKTTEYYSNSGLSIKYSMKNNFPDFYTQYPNQVVETLREVAEDAKDFAEPLTPMKTGRLRESATVVVYRNGLLGGTVYLQWRATNPRNGFHYGIVQEAGGTMDPPATYENYTTPGTGPGFMASAWGYIEQTAPEYVAQATNDLIHEVST